MQAHSMERRILMRITEMLAGALSRAIGFLPNLVAALIILVVGLLLAKLLERLTRRALAALGLDHRRSVRRLLGQEASLERIPTVGSRIVFWVLSLVTVGVAVDALHLAWLSAGVARVLAYVPNLLAAGAIVAVAYIVGNAVYTQATARQGASTTFARLARGAIYVLAAFMALQELGIATAIVTMAFTVALAGMAIAAALAFGLGNRELAGRVTRDWYERRGPRYRSYEPTRTDEEVRRTEPPH
jgi:hypothetical protein